jgi:type III secretion system FlhB-like substrate exporter
MRRAVALQYDPDPADSYGAPFVVSSGEGYLAERIERAARDYGVPVVRDLPLVLALSEIAEGDAIPGALYESVAAVLQALEDARNP